MEQRTSDACLHGFISSIPDTDTQHTVPSPPPSISSPSWGSPSQHPALLLIALIQLFWYSAPPRKFKLPTTCGLPDGIDDCCVHFWCLYCASHQEMREVVMRGLDGPGLHALDVHPQSWEHLSGYHSAVAARQGREPTWTTLCFICRAAVLCVHPQAWERLLGYHSAVAARQAGTQQTILCFSLGRADSFARREPAWKH